VPTVRKSLRQILDSKPQIDYDKFDAATEEDIARWKREDGIEDSTWGPPQVVIPGPDVRAIRERLGLSQEAFAERFQLSLRTLQDWEQKRRVPEGPARVLLRVIEREPEAAARALAGSKRP
jgi:putative transcriptional regulator